jgi:SAM-dependent methyltransferase
MTQLENDYRQEVFLAELRDKPDRSESRIWQEHQSMQLQFLRRSGLSSRSTVLDLGCGPMRLGSVLIPELCEGWYFGQDLNPETLAYGEEVLRQAAISVEANYTLFASEQFDLGPVDRPIQIAFSNSLFSHLTLNSIVTCLLQLRSVLARNGVYYSTFFSVPVGDSWLQPQPRNKWGRQFHSYPHQDPYHYHPTLLKSVAREAGYRMDVLTDYGHPTQAMARFRLRKRWF